MLKTTGSSNKPAFNGNNGSKLTSSKNNDSMPASKRNNSNGEVDEFSVSRNNVEHTKKSGKLFQSGKSKSKKMFKSQNLAKSRKKLSKSENSTNFDAIRAGSKFLILNTRKTFNYLQLAFTEVSIL